MKNFGYGEVKLTEGFFTDRLTLNARTIRAVYNRFKENDRFEMLKCKFNAENPPARMRNIAGAAEIAKWVEGLVYYIARTDDALAKGWYEEIVNDIVSSQREDGYYHPYFQVYEPELIFGNRDNHELYTAGLFMEAGIAASNVLGDDRLLAFSEKFADLIHERFVVKKDTAFTTPGHEEIELALLKMYAYTGKEKFKTLAEFFLNERGQKEEQEAVKGQRWYSQSHIPVKRQREATGHAVRAMLLYTAMAEAAKLNGDEELKEATKALFEDVYKRKSYITGGIGSAFPGEKFTVDYDLPNFKAYSETCAAFALLLFCDGMMKLDGKAVYGHLFERALYNALLAGISLDGEGFFYVNPLEMQKKKAAFNLYKTVGWQHDPVPLLTRAKTFNCPCCPPNLCRFFETLPQYIWYADKEKSELILSQHISSKIENAFVKAEVVSEMPYGGKVRVKVNSYGKEITLKVRVPEWCDKPFDNERDGYLVYEGVFGGEEIKLDFPMTLKRVYANPLVEEDAEKVAFRYGPLILCAEEADNGALVAVRVKKEGNGGVEIAPNAPYILTAWVDGYGYEWTENLYLSQKPQAVEKTIKLIPYFAWANREEGDMKVWFNEI